MRLKENVMANYLGRFYTITIGIVILPIYLQYLGAEAYGLVGFFTMLMSWIMLLDMGFSKVLSREAARLKDKEGGIVELKMALRSVESIMLILGLIIYIAIFIFTDWISIHWLDINELPLNIVETSIKIMGFILIIKWYVSLYNSLILGFEEQVWLNIYKVLIATFRSIGGLILVIYITNNIFYYFIYQALVTLIEITILNRKVYSRLPQQTTIMRPSIKAIKKIAPFALGVGYTSGVWVVYTQLDKLLLSHYIPLNEYGYFTLVVLVSGAIMQFSSPLSQAIIPRMTSLLSNGRERDMLNIYKKGTLYIAILIFSVVGIISFYSYELLYSWTGDSLAATWASPVLFWYAIGNGVLSISAFQYYLQFAHGDLTYHIKFNTYFPLITLPIVFYSVTHYGAIGAGIAWFVIQFISFLFWPYYIHNRFAKGIHRDWVLKCIVPPLIITIAYIFLLNYIDIDFTNFSRFWTFLLLTILGLLLLILNLLSVSEIKAKIKQIIDYGIYKYGL